MTFDHVHSKFQFPGSTGRLFAALTRYLFLSQNSDNHGQKYWLRLLKSLPPSPPKSMLVLVRGQAVILSNIDSGGRGRWKINILSLKPIIWAWVNIFWPWLSEFGFINGHLVKSVKRLLMLLGSPNLVYGCSKNITRVLWEVMQLKVLWPPPGPCPSKWGHFLLYSMCVYRDFQ